MNKRQLLKYIVSLPVLALLPSISFANTKSVTDLEWDEIKYNSQREETYESVSKKSKEFVNFDELYPYYEQLLNDKRNKNIIGYRMEWIDLDKKLICKPGHRGASTL